MRQVVRRAVRAAAGVLVASVFVTLAGCDAGGSGADDKGAGPAGIRIRPADGERGVRGTDPVEVTVASGRLERVRLVRSGDALNRPVPGTFSSGGQRWRSTAERLRGGSRYAVDVVAVDRSGRRSAHHSTFTTRVPVHRFIGFFKPEHRSTVGTGTIVSLEFTHPVTDRVAVERAIRVRALPAVPVAAHWFGPRRLDFRPRTYWAPGTRVTMTLRLRGVKAAPGAFGIQSKTVQFTIGRSQVSTVDAAAHLMRVRRDGRQLTVIPITAGRRETPTYNGKMVVMERYDVTRMDGDTVGFGGEYDIPDVPHAMRLTRSGTFLHGNYWAPERIFGSDNTSHGCIGLHDVRGGGGSQLPTPAAWFYANSMVGDVIEVVNSNDRTVAPDNGYGGWNMSWEDWKAGSALD
ncbi:Ig-like domain-containing protein [Streptomyces sp. MTZ3.1]|uniref:Ig-like domain-containing protein n=1 Tax=Streptomyces meridianus TaxID=2938945 RepID=A0ABT0X6F3_9ACTN|nr:Ig-like domain-containing protein [Streptomyces meridianus]MCM2578101.1 Ig-like domain-containing protein [Streptomyces meridianus]